MPRLDTKTMNNVADYLQIDFDPILISPTLNNLPVESSNFSTGKIFHNPFEKLTKKNKKLLRFMFYGWEHKLSLFKTETL